MVKSIKHADTCQDLCLYQQLAAAEIQDVDRIIVSSTKTIMQIHSSVSPLITSLPSPRPQLSFNPDFLFSSQGKGLVRTSKPPLKDAAVGNIPALI